MVLSLSGSVALAQEGQDYLNSLINSMQVIDGRLEMSITLTNGAVGYASIGGVIEDQALDEALITQAMFIAYQDAMANVLAYDYAIAQTAQQLFSQEASAAMYNLEIAVDNLVNATSAIAMATNTLEAASVADTKPEQVALQEMLVTEEYSIQAAEVDAYNEAVSQVEYFAQQAGAFMAASNNSELTASIDSYAAQGNFMVGTYTAITYTQSVDEFAITWGDAGFAAGWSNYLTNDTKTAADVYNAGVYINQYGVLPSQGVN